MTDTEFLKEVKERADRATEGPWVVDRPWLSRGMMHVYGVMPRANLHPDAPYLVETVHNHGSKSASKHVAVPAHGHSADDRSDAANNMEFIAHAREDVPRLLAMIEERNEKLRVAEKALDTIRKCCLCDRDTKGFDYHEEHPRLGKAKSGSRWLAPEIIAIEALAAIRGSDDKT